VTDVGTGATRRLRQAARHPLTIVASGILALVILLALGTVFIDPASPPNDDLFRLALGARTSLAAGLIGVTVSVIAGTISGLIAALHSGRFDTIIGWIAYLTASVPALIFLLVIVVDSADSVVASMVIFGVLLTAPVYVLTRNTTLQVEGRPAVHARRQRGLTTVRLIARSVLPALRADLWARVLLVFALMVAVHAIFGVLGRGGTGDASWGLLVRENMQALPDTTLVEWLPAVGLLLTVVSPAIIGLAILRSGRQPSVDVFRAAPRTHDDDPWGDEPVPSTWFRSSALVDVRGLRIQATPGGNSPEIVSNVSLTIANGETVGFLGTPASGALEIALALSGLLAPRRMISGGSILFDGTELTSLPERALNRLRGTRISYVPQKPLTSLDPAHTIGRHLFAPLHKTLGVSRSASARLALELLARVGFDDPASTLLLYPRDLTEVMAQRVLIAGAVSCQPDLVVANDPTASLDRAGAASILALLRSLQHELGFTLIVVTADVHVIAESCKQVAVVEAGMIVEHASVRDLLAAPQHSYTQRLLESAGPVTAPGPEMTA